MHALRDTLQQDKELTPLNTSLGIVGLSTSTTATVDPITGVSAASGLIEHPYDGPGSNPYSNNKQPGFEKFRIIEGDGLVGYLKSMDPKEVPESSLQAEAARAATTAAENAAALVAAEAAPAAAPAGDASAAGGDAMETD